MSRHPWYVGNICTYVTYSDILGRENPTELASIVVDSVSRLTNKNKNVQKKGVKILAALAQTCKHILVVQSETTDELASGW